MSHPGQNPGQQPVSFKTVPGRHRTQKWTQAKTNNYDGDDWGGYDPYDEFGDYDDPASASHHRDQYGQGLQRQPSFDRGVDTERRQFSSGTQPEQHTSPIAGSGGISHHSRSPDSSRSHPREFSNPGQVPQPLNTPRSPPPAGSVERPPRKSSLGSVSPGPDARPIPATTSPNTGKALPFIRPSDIYKRMADEQQKERQSMESGRPSMDSVQRELGSPSAAQPALTQQKSHESVPSASGQTSTLDPVNETSEPKPVALGISQPTVGSTDSAEHDPLHPEESSPRLAPVSRVSGFGSFMPRNEEEERISATGLAASTAAANAAASALSSSRDVTPTMPGGHFGSTHDHPVHSPDPALDIANERSTATAAEDVGRAPGEDPSGLSHQPSSGFRSVVHKAFDTQGDGSTPESPVSREHNQSVVSRSDTNSTGSISPIMSRVPSAATAQKKQQERDAVVPSIAEETPLEIARSRPFPGSALPAMSPKPSIKRKPTPSHSRNVSSDITGFTPGYRRSMETPSPNNSPARTPGVADADTRRFSGPMAAQTVTDPEAPDVSPDAPEMPSATLHPVETPLETPGSVNTSTTGTDIVKPLPTTGRGRSGTDYSIRESDLAQEASSLPSQHPDVAEAVTQQQKLFLDTHPNFGSGPNSPTVLSPTSGVARPFSRPTTAGGSGRDSPAGTSHSRVRNIVDQYHQMDEESRRNSAASGMSSKSSWSNFGGDEDPQPGLTRKATGGSMLSQQTPASPGDTGMFPSYDHADATAEPSTIKPEAERQESFRPHLPGEWVSATATPASEVPDAMAAADSRGREVTPASPPTPRGQQIASADEEIDLTPTTRKTKLRESDPTLDSEEREQTNPVAAVKNAGEALGSALMAHAGYGHQTQDFASKGEAAPVDIPEMRPHRETGDIQHLNVPPLRRENSDAPSEVTLGSVGPTPPAKDTPQPPGLDANSGPSDGRPTSNYFAGYDPDAVAPLSFGKNSPGTAHEPTFTRPAVLPTLSTDTGAADFESDRLRKDIVRSLGPESMDNLKQQSMQEDAHKIQNALDAPANERRVASGQSALPPAEVRNAEGRSALPSQSRPGLLGQRFSWENRSADDDGLYGPMAVVGETEGDENRESFGRPRSNQGLHVVNTQVVADSEPSTAEAEKQAEPDFMLKEPADAEKRLSAALPVGTTALAHGSPGHSFTDHLASPVAEDPESKNGGLSEVAPTAMVEDDSDANRSGEPQSPRAPPKDVSPTLPSTSAAPPQQSAAAQAKIPAFRDLAAIKSTPDRIAAYESTRHRFADMNTGLQGWLSGMLAAHPEYANAGSQKYEGPAAIQTTGLSNTISGIGGTIRNHGHKHSGSILKIGGERKASTTGSTHAAPESGSGGGHVDVEKMQAKGKDFMKSAGAGAKGLFAKGKSRFGRGGEKASVSSPLSVAIPAAPTPASSAADAKPSPVPTPTTAARPLSRPVTPADLRNDDAMTSDRAPAAVGAGIERPRSVFGRLRDASRPHSRSRPGSAGVPSESDRKSPGPSRSVSRAASHIFGRSEAASDSQPAAPIPSSSAAQPGPPTTFPPTSLGAMPDPLLRRREAWEDPDAELGDAARWREENARLGVLPSPSVHESISASSPSGGNGRKGSWIGETLVVEPLEEVRGEEDAQHGVHEGDGPAGLIARRAGEESKTSVPAPGLQEEGSPAASASQSAGEQSKPSIPPPDSQETDIRRFSMPPENRAPSPQPEQTRSASVAMPSTAARPQPERRTSALDQLPSQQRRRQFTPVGTPRRLSLADGGATIPVPPSDTMPGAELAQTAPLAGENGGRQAGPSKISRPPTPANWEMLSFFSAPKSAPAADAVSRRSSVSSLGDAQSPDVIVTGSKNQSAVGLPASAPGVADEQERNVSPVPVSPIVPDAELSHEDRFMNRSYKTSAQPESRPMSYMPLGRDSSGMPVQEAIGVNQQSNKTYSTASDVGEPHSQGPSRTPSRAPSLGLPQKEYDKLRSPQPGDDEAVPSGANSRRSSGFFRGSDAPPAMSMGPIPTPSRIEDGFNNLEDPQVNEIADDIAKAEQQQQQKHARRKSGIMDTFRRASTHSITATRASSPGSLAKITVANANEGTSVPKSKTLKKLKRDPSSAVESKPKRFSGLGSLFRRSSTHPKSSATPPPGSQAAPAQPTKQAPPGDMRAGSQIQPSPQRYPQPTAGLAPKPSRKLTKTPPPIKHYSQPPQQYYPTPPPGNYAAYEAMMRQQGIAPNGRQIPPQYWQQQQQQQQMYMEPAMMNSPFQQQPPSGAYQQQQQQPSGYYQQGPPIGQYQANPSSGQNSRTQSFVGSPVTHQNQPMEYYAVPQGYPAEKTASPEQSQARPQVRRLHSEGHRWVETAPGIPEASSPVSPADEKFGAAAEKPLAGGQAVATEQGSMAQDPPPHQSSPAPTRPQLNTRQSSNYSQASVARSPASATQPLDNFPQAPGRQDYQTQYWQHQNKPQHPRRSVSPIQTYAVPPSQRQQSHVGSIDQQMARSPAQEYHEQQTPWAISMPASEQENSHGYSSPPPNWPHQSPAHSPQPQYYGPPPAARGAVRSMSPPGPPRRHSQFQDQYSAMTPYHFVPPPQKQHHQQRASSYGEQMTTSPATYTPTSPPHYAPAPQQQGRSQAQTRYYSQPQPQQQQRQVTQQDMEVAREMRAVSYPGQGWEPGR